MPGGAYDSSKTRVKPVFDRLHQRSGDWPRQLIELARHGASDGIPLGGLDLAYRRGYWGPKEECPDRPAPLPPLQADIPGVMDAPGCERGLHPPVSLLSWLIRHPDAWPPGLDSEGEERRSLRVGDPPAVELALAGLRRGCPDRSWFILEGRTYPDALLETPDALIVIEGKRTEPGPTTHTTWMPGRHQIWRHIDAAWEIRGRRQVFGFFIVEAENGEIPDVWIEAARCTLEAEVLRGSFPHRSADEVAELRRCFRGVTTWSQVCQEFSIDKGQLPDTVPGARGNARSGVTP